jgi:hypothetical protein
MKARPLATLAFLAGIALLIVLGLGDAQPPLAKAQGFSCASVRNPRGRMRGAGSALHQHQRSWLEQQQRLAGWLRARRAVGMGCYAGRDTWEASR